MRRAAFLLTGALLGGAALASGAARSGPPPILANESASLPRGLYARSGAPPAAGRIVALIPPPSALSYLAGLGAKPDAHLLKRVVATEGARVCKTGDHLVWPGGSAFAQRRDRRGRALPRWQGCRRLAPQEFLVIGDTSTSFDSRYFGPIAGSAVLGVYREVWTW